VRPREVLLRTDNGDCFVRNISSDQVALMERQEVAAYEAGPVESIAPAAFNPDDACSDFRQVRPWMAAVRQCSHLRIAVSQLACTEMSKLPRLVLAFALLCACSSGDDADGADRPRKVSKSDHAEKEQPPDLPAASTTLGDLGLSAVWGSGPDDVWIVGSEGMILHFDGKDLRRVQSPTTNRLNAVYGTGPDDVWVVGEAGATFRWDGSGFQDFSGLDDEVLLGVWASGPGDVWIVGSATTARAGLVRRLDGAQRVLEDIVPGCSSLWEIWGSGPDDIWMVGSTPETRGLALHGDGLNFGPVEMMGGPLRGVWGSSHEDVWVIPYDTAAQHWDGSTLEPSDDQPDKPMLAAWGSSASDVWAVGLEGSIRHFDGSSWSAHESGVKYTLWSVWGSDADDVWAVGGTGTLLRWRGEEWKAFEGPLLE
jgi:hypothetical protein